MAKCVSWVEVASAGAQGSHRYYWQFMACFPPRPQGVAMNQHPLKFKLKRRQQSITVALGDRVGRLRKTDMESFSDGKANRSLLSSCFPLSTNALRHTEVLPNAL